MRIGRMQKKILVIFLVALVTATCSSCMFSAIEAKKRQQAGGKISGVIQKTENLKPLYYDFRDILVPGELTEDKRNSSVVGTGSNITGFLSFYGRVELRSLIRFFEIKVPEDGWKMISVVKSPFSTNMIFHKGKRWCLITLSEKGFTTEVGIGVSQEI